ncbi:MAG: 2-C-methyl-D-erythritol 4-phosphate cytidylyltransferase [Nitrospirae bacterium]|nr:2-C-methyl-D-erythritol 4-phosphate cytidylyltransferase [Nitrospirota bacterium]
MRNKIVAIVPAAGFGKRFGPGGNKQFQSLKDKPLIVWTLKVFESIRDIEEVIPVLKNDDMEAGLDLIDKYRLSKVKKIAPGGKERQDSVFSGLNLVEKKTAAVLIHDGVRPFFKRSLVEESINQLKDCDGVVAGIPVKDTIKGVSTSNVRNEIIVEKTLNRSLLWAVQTPQVFRYDILMNAYAKAMEEGFYSTDDSAIVERYGGKVKIIMGDYSNIKITTPEDLDIAEVLLRKRLDNV